MRKFLIIAALGCAFLLAPLATVHAQIDIPNLFFAADEEPLPTTQPKPIAVVSGPEDIEVNKTIILDASKSLVEGEAVEYRWYIGASQQWISRSVQALYTPTQPGELLFRLVIRSTEAGQTKEYEAMHKVTVYNRKIVIVTDSHVPQKTIQERIASATQAGVYLKILSAIKASAPLGEEETLVTLMTEQRDTFAGADTIVLWTSGIAGLQAFTRVALASPELRSLLPEQTLVIVSDYGPRTFGRLARGSFSVLHPKQIIIARDDAIPAVVSSPTNDSLLASMAEQNLGFTVLNAATVQFQPWDIFSMLVSYILTRGVSSQMVILLLMLPIIATILTFLKQVVGITTFGLYTPSIIALSFLSLGWAIGVMFLIFIIASGYFTRAVMRRWRLLYVPKVAIILTSVSISLLLLLGMCSYYGIILSRDTVFVLLIMSTLAENFLHLKTEEGWYSAIISIVETVFGALICVGIVQTPFFQSLIIAYPELIFLTVAINVALGRWTGLRLVEYFRFRDVFKYLQEE